MKRQHHQDGDLLYKTQPAISARIQQLENELGCTLVHREKGKKSIILTPRGEAFLKTAQKFIELYGEIDETRFFLSNSITISTIGSLSATLVPDICNRVISRHHTKMSLLVYQSIEAYQMVANKQLDLAFVSTSSEVPGVDCDALFRLDYVVVQACEQPGPPIHTTLDRFDPKAEIYQRWNPAFDTWHNSRFGTRNYLIHVDSCNVMKQFLQQPGSWAIVQRSNLPELTREFPVQIYELLDPPPTLHLLPYFQRLPRPPKRPRHPGILRRRRMPTRRRMAYCHWVCEKDMDMRKGAVAK